MFNLSNGDSMEYVEKTLKRNYIYKGKVINLRCDDAELFNGEPCKREIIEHSGGACVLCEDNGKILFVKQYRYAYGESLLEIPAGKLNDGEEPCQTALRELAEETGIKAGGMEFLQVLYPTPGYTNEKIYLYRAKGIEKTKQNLDDGEFLDVVWITEEKVQKMLNAGEIRDAKTVVALQRYFLEKR